MCRGYTAPCYRSPTWRWTCISLPAWPSRTRPPTSGNGSSSIASWGWSASFSTTTQAPTATGRRSRPTSRTDWSRWRTGPRRAGGPNRHVQPMPRAKRPRVALDRIPRHRRVPLLPTGRPLPDLLREYEQWPGVVANWAIFGTSGHRTRPPGPVIDSYRWRNDDPEEPRNRIFKCIVDPARVVRCLDPHSFEFTEGGFVDERKQPVEGQFGRTGRSTRGSGSTTTTRAPRRSARTSTPADAGATPSGCAGAKRRSSTFTRSCTTCATRRSSAMSPRS